MADNDKGWLHWQKIQQQTTPTRHAQTTTMHNSITTRNATTATTTIKTSLGKNTATDETRKGVPQDTAVLHITASPRQIKTQIARITYVSAATDGPPNQASKSSKKTTTKQSIATKPTNETPLTTPQTQETHATTRDEFNRKKDEREKEIQAIQEMLNEISNSPKGAAIVDRIVIDETVNNAQYINKEITFRRSKSEFDAVRPRAATTRRNAVRNGTAKQRSRSSQPPPTKSSELFGGKKKSYNAEGARRFMEEQKHKRRTQINKLLPPSREKSAFEKEQIKKRLEELRKNSREIVNKNVRKKSIFIQDSSTHAAANDAQLLEGVADASPNKVAEFDNNCQGINNNMKVPKSTLEQQPTASNIEMQKSVMDNAKATTSTHAYPLMENQKRIGLLRKQEMKDHSYSAIKEYSFDKENVALEMLTPQLAETRIREKSVAVATPATISTPNVNIVEKATIQPTIEESKSTTDSLRKKMSRHSGREQSKRYVDNMQQTDNTRPEVAREAFEEPQHDTQLPYWLKPSAVQVFPYNFIMAVRRKLEAIAHPTGMEKPSNLAADTKHQCTSTGDLQWKECKATTLSLKSGNSKHETNKKDSAVVADVVDVFEHSSHSESRKTVASAAVSLHDSNEQSSKSKTPSELHSNFSSISIQLATSNTVSEISSLKSDIVAKSKSKQELKQASRVDEDTTTVSSSIYNSPEKKTAKTNLRADFDFVAPRPLSPLSLEHVENLKIASKSKLKCSTIKAQEKQNVNEVSVDFNQLLDDFNRSLSQVIQVNEKLKHTLEKSQQINSPRSSVTSAVQEKYENRKIDVETEGEIYTTDFEESSHRAQLEAANQRTSKIQNSFQKRRRNLFEIASVVKPMLTSPKAAYMEEQTTTENMQLNQEKIANSSLKSSTESISQQLEDSVEDKSNAVSINSYETRLQVIEQLKTNLKQSILNASAQRANEDENTQKDLNKDTNKYQNMHSNVDNEQSFPLSNSNSETNTLPVNSPEKETHLSSVSSPISPKMFTFVVNTENSNSNDTPTRKSIKSVDDSQSISEDLQIELELPDGGKDNENGNDKSHMHAEFIKTHVNTSRGDFLLNLDENAVANETQWHAAIAASKCINADGGSDGSSTTLSGAPPSYKTDAPLTAAATNGTAKHKIQTAKQSVINVGAIGSELMAIFKESDLELTGNCSEGSLSETSLNYSNVGLYKKLIQKETTKSEHLTVLLRMREKALIDRTKGQIAWLEMQKGRYKAKGLPLQIAAIRKKQRAIIIKMAKERDEIKRLLQSTISTSSTQSPSTKHSSALPIHLPTQKRKRERFSCAHACAYASPETQQFTAPPAAAPLSVAASISTNFHKSSTHSLQQSQQYAKQQKLITEQLLTSSRSAPSAIVRGNYELESSQSLEELLRRREEDLRRRREHVERLMQWHRRLDEEETEVLQLERMLLDYNNTHACQTNEKATTEHEKQLEHASQQPSPNSTVHAIKMERRLREIDKSLRELSSISDGSTHTDPGGDYGAEGAPITSTEFVRTSGNKLNKLWRRLTSQQVEKFEPNRRYKLCKTDLERLYEEAKLVVLQNFDEERLAAELLEKSTASNVSSCSNGYAAYSQVNVPHLNLHLSSEHSEADEECGGTTPQSPPTAPEGNYSPSAAEQHFQMRRETANSRDSDANVTPKRDRVAQYLLYTQQLLNVATKFAGTGVGTLRRSLSDPQLTEHTLPLQIWHSQSAATSQRDLHTEKKKSVATFAFTRTAAGNELPLNDTPQSPKSLSSISNESGAHIPQGPVPAYSNATSAGTSSHSVITSNISLGAVRDSSVLHSMGHASVLSTYSGQFSTDSERKALEIAAKLDEISNAVSQLSQSNSLPMYQCTKSTETETDICTLVDTGNISKTISDNVENVSGDAIYSSHFEQTNSDMYSPSGCTLKSSLTTAAQSNVESISPVSTLKSQANPADITIEDGSDIACTKTFTITSPEALQSKTFVSASNHSALENRPLDMYEVDFESTNANVSDETCLEDMSMPQFETTTETTYEEEASDENIVEQIESSKKKFDSCSSKPDKTVKECADETTTPHTNIAACKELLPPLPPPPPPPPPSGTSTTVVATASTSNNSTQLMPDIINELEIRRCQQILLESEHLKQYEHVTAVPYMYVREIPNKPPPPYVPPAHGSPMTTIFPSEDRIKDITYRRTHELYCELLKTDYTNDKGEKLPSVIEEKITNIYERIILDICREYLGEHQEVLNQGDPINFHSQLAFFNPPDRLRCIQQSIYKEVRRCLAMDKTLPKRTQVYSVYGQRAKRDHIGKIIIQEMYDEDDRWCNFHREENEVLDLIVEEMLNNQLQQLASDVLVEEGGTIDKQPDEATDTDENNTASEIVQTASTTMQQADLIENTSIFSDLNAEEKSVAEDAIETITKSSTGSTDVVSNDDANISNEEAAVASAASI